MCYYLPEICSMHPCFLSWCLVLGLCGCTPHLGLENSPSLELFLSRKEWEAGEDVAATFQPAVNLSTEPLT